MTNYDQNTYLIGPGGGGGGHSHGLTGIAQGSHTHQLYPSTQPYWSPNYGVGSTWSGPSGGNINTRSIDDILKEHFLTAIERNLYNQTPVTRALTQGMDPMKQIINEVFDERRKAKEKARIEAMLTDYDEFDISGLPNKQIFAFTRTIGEKTYDYAVLKANDAWYFTGCETSAHDDEALVQKLIEWNVALADITWHDPE